MRNKPTNHPTFKISSYTHILLPECPDFFPYPHVKSEIGKICYLTVQESFVEAGSTQRRPGLHVDCAGIVKIAGVEGGKGDKTILQGKEGDGESWKYNDHHWGHGGCQVTV